MITDVKSSVENFDALKERLEDETPDSNSTDRDEIEAELSLEENRMFRSDVESDEEFLEDIEGHYEREVSVRREWSIDRSGQEAGVPFQNKNSGSVNARAPVSFNIEFGDKSSVLGFKDTLSDNYEVPNLRYVSQGEANSISEAMEDFQDSERLLLRYNNFSVALQEKDGGWNLTDLEFEYNFRDQTVDPEKLKIPYNEIIEDVKEAADDNEVDYSEEVFETAAEEHEDYVEWATENDSRYEAEDILNPESSEESEGLFDRLI